MLLPGDIVRVKFPYTESKDHKYRPALVVSNTSLHKNFGMCWVAMITSAKNAPWQEDISLAVSEDTGLPVASVARPSKLATIQTDKVEKIGKAPETALNQALEFIRYRLM